MFDYTSLAHAVIDARRRPRHVLSFRKVSTPPSTIKLTNGPKKTCTGRTATSTTLSTTHNALLQRRFFFQVFCAARARNTIWGLSTYDVHGCGVACYNRAAFVEALLVLIFLLSFVVPLIPLVARVSLIGGCCSEHMMLSSTLRDNKCGT